MVMLMKVITMARKHVTILIVSNFGKGKVAVQAYKSKIVTYFKCLFFL